jgi:hypothetical protein
MEYAVQTFAAAAPGTGRKNLTAVRIGPDQCIPFGLCCRLPLQGAADDAADDVMA